ncbi:MAG TPA: GvpL/GvpF family gas vesicle protein [Vicinamibacterales bacterium]|nr:GvpL/GvpF family gas vesicle protein [Vicinamibacterales bacterium]
MVHTIPTRFDMAVTATYLYCIVHASRTPLTTRAPRGLPGATRPAAAAVARPFWLITASVPLDVYGPAALESSLRNVRWVTDVALAHESVVEHFARQPRATVIPMKLFTMFSSESLAIAETRSRIKDLEAVVERIAGCEEWGVRITRPPATAAGSSPRTSAAVSGTEFLSAKKAARDHARQSGSAAVESAEQAYLTLSGLARETRRRRDAPDGATTPPLLDAAFLVPVDRRRHFKAAVKKLADTSGGTRVALTGPWPSYNFIDAESNL